MESKLKEIHLWTISPSATVHPSMCCFQIPPLFPPWHQQSLHLAIASDPPCCPTTPTCLLLLPRSLSDPPGKKTIVERQASPVSMVPFQGQALSFREGNHLKATCLRIKELGSWKLILVHPLQATNIYIYIIPHLHMVWLVFIVPNFGGVLYKLKRFSFERQQFRGFEAIVVNLFVYLGPFRNTRRTSGYGRLIGFLS